jgi:hypothetical protein
MTAGETPDDCAVVVVMPKELPALTTSSARALLGILVELATVELLDEPSDGDRGSG